MNLTELMECIPHLREILHIVREAFENYDDPAHDISHTFRVTENASEIASREKCDLQKAVAAALLHDIKRPQEALTGIDHAESGAEYVLRLLPTMGFNISFVSEVSQAIRSHRYSGALTPSSMTGKILQDADRLDAIYLFFQRKHRFPHHIRNKRSLHFHRARSSQNPLPLETWRC
ncbi:MAG: putative HD superfamily hydrolase [Mesotoga infera]|uniref:Putative HD superfamily hydrolase n=1 Tax=Mesotoga infera TaxID=1236046 RepID=A0A101H011_9BACT|nr:MAG: putative HD superfamily hydrolase [Mesotoga infera]